VLLSDYTTQVQELVHDSAFVDYSQAEMTSFINNARVRVSLDMASVRTYFTNCSTIVNQETYPITGGVGGATITNGGVYSSPPTVTFAAPPAGGAQATGIALMSGTAPNMAVTQIGMTNWGRGYTAVPTVTFGSGAAAATAVALINVIDIYAVSYLYGVQRARLQFKPFGVFNTFFRYNTTTSGHPCVWSIYHQQNLFYLFPALPDQNYPLEIDAIVTAAPLVNVTDSDVQINAPENDLVQYYAAHLALLKAQNFAQAEYYNNKYGQRKTEILATRYAPRIQNPYQNAWRRIQRGY
jgi:hypothetical protein